MMLEPIIKPARVNFNNDEVIAEVEKIVAFYEHELAQAKTVKDYKSLRANLNRDLKVANDRRKQIKQKITEEFTAFEKFFKTQEKKFDYILNECRAFLNKEEEKRIEEKMYEIENIEGFDLFKQYYDIPQKWYNKTYKLSDIEAEIKEDVSNIKNAKHSIKVTADSCDLVALDKYYDMLANGNELSDILATIHVDAYLIKKNLELKGVFENIRSLESEIENLDFYDSWLSLKKALYND